MPAPCRGATSPGGGLGCARRWLLRASSYVIVAALLAVGVVAERLAG
jgi:hypothetical protein